MTMMEHQRKYEKPLAKYVKIALVTPTFSWLKSAILQGFELLFTRSILQIVINQQQNLLFFAEVSKKLHWFVNFECLLFFGFTIS